MSQEDSGDEKSVSEVPVTRPPLGPIAKLFLELRDSSVEKWGGGALEAVQGMLKYREDRTYHLLRHEKGEYLESMWQHMQSQLQVGSEWVEGELIQAINNRVSGIVADIEYQVLEVQQHLKPYDYEEQLKQKKLSMLKDQSDQIQKKLNDIGEGMTSLSDRHSGQSRLKPFQIREDKIKEYEQFLKKQKKEKDDRAKVIEEQRKKQEEAKKKREEEQKQAQESIAKERKQELVRKLKESQEKRIKEKREREQRNKEYHYISKSFAQQPPLFKKLQANFHHRYQLSENQKRNKIKSERKSMYDPIDSNALEDHQRKYEEMRAERERQRQEKMQETERMLELQQEERNKKYQSSYELKPRYVDPKVQARKEAQEKNEKMKKYIEETVKERYLPRIDEEKRRELLQMMEDLGKKKVKKVRHEDGSYDYEEVKPSDARMVGLEYLEKTKQIANKMRSRRKSSENIGAGPEESKPRVVDYLAEQRKKSSKSNRDRLGFVSRRGVSFDDKLKKVELESEKLEELARQKEMKLKFGKFSTSDEILQHKEQIDQHYIDIINMKLKLINYKED